MSRGLFYVETLPAVGGLAILDGDEGFHAANVRRTRPGEQLDLGDGAGTVAHCVVEDVAKGRLSARVQAIHLVKRPTPTVTVVQALPKAERSELAIELATEAGADAFVGWQAARCVARWGGPEKVEKGLRRWAAVARSAARQSRRPYIPAVEGVVTTAGLVDRVRAASPSTVLVLHESATGLLASATGLFGLAAGLPASATRPAAEALTLVVGPEGGIADEELEALGDAGAVLIRLGPTVLRTSTAAAVALGALGVLTSRWC
ncbi:MAG: 16S rRNA (uracil(1498)-N(3))-methyltransferase [Mycobacterium sp.]